MRPPIVKYIGLISLAALAWCGGGCASQHDGLLGFSEKPIRVARPHEKIHLRAGASAVVCVHANSEWNGAGVLARPGERYTFSVRRDAVWRDAGWRVGMDGTASKAYKAYMSLHDRNKRVPDAPWFALVATADKSNEAAWVVGYGTSHRVQAAGEIFLFANDVSGFYWNNSGRVLVSITRDK